MLRPLSVLFSLLLLTTTGFSQTAPDAAELTKLLNDFLFGAGHNDATMHDRFWAEDLIYTGGGGRRVGKADIMKDVRSSPTLVRDQRTTYTAEDIRIQQYGNTAIVAFRLVAKVERSDSVDITHHFNTGTFLKRDGKWQVVAWQATRLPRDSAQTTKQLLAIDDKFAKAILAADVDALGMIVDESFIWTQDAGAQITAKQFVENLRSGRLKFSQVENRNVTVSASGDTAVVRGETIRRRVSAPASPGAADATSYNAFYTLTFVNKGGLWKAVSLHTSRQ